MKSPGSCNPLIGEGLFGRQLSLKKCDFGLSP
jgi:hypothetical protein